MIFLRNNNFTLHLQATFFISSSVICFFYNYYFSWEKKREREIERHKERKRFSSLNYMLLEEQCVLHKCMPENIKTVFSSIVSSPAIRETGMRFLVEENFILFLFCSFFIILYLEINISLNVSSVYVINSL